MDDTAFPPASCPDVILIDQSVSDVLVMVTRSFENTRAARRREVYTTLQATIRCREAGRLAGPVLRRKPRVTNVLDRTGEDLAMMAFRADLHASCAGLYQCSVASARLSHSIATRMKFQLL